MVESLKPDGDEETKGSLADVVLVQVNEWAAEKFTEEGYRYPNESEKNVRSVKLTGLARLVFGTAVMAAGFSLEVMTLSAFLIDEGVFQHKGFAPYGVAVGFALTPLVVASLASQPAMKHRGTLSYSFVVFCVGVVMTLLGFSLLVMRMNAIDDLTEGGQSFWATPNAITAFCCLALNSYTSFAGMLLQESARESL